MRGRRRGGLSQMSEGEIRLAEERGRGSLTLSKRGHSCKYQTQDWMLSKRKSACDNVSLLKKNKINQMHITLDAGHLWLVGMVCPFPGEQRAAMLNLDHRIGIGLLCENSTDLRIVFSGYRQGSHILIGVDCFSLYYFCFQTVFQAGRQTVELLNSMLHTAVALSGIWE